MDKYIICADVSTDIDINVYKSSELAFVPMDYSMGEEMRTCTGPETRETLKKFYDGQRNGDLTKTSQITPYMYQEIFSKYMEQGYSVLYLCLSSGLSSTYQSSLMAKDALKEEYPDLDLYSVDSLAATGGMGVLAERAIRNLRNGMSIEDNSEDLKTAASRIKHWFMVKDLQYLKRGGRISSATAIIGSALNIIPILEINKEGKLDTIDKKRGIKMACSSLVSHFKESYDEDSGDVIYVIDADTAETGDMLESEIKALYPNAVVRRSGLSPIIGAHTGPNMAAICHIAK